jgi:hypothetical protein
LDRWWIDDIAEVEEGKQPVDVQDAGRNPEAGEILWKERDSIVESFSVQMDVNAREALPWTVRIVVQVPMRLTVDVDSCENDGPPGSRLELQSCPLSVSALDVEQKLLPPVLRVKVVLLFERLRPAELDWFVGCEEFL